MKKSKKAYSIGDIPYVVLLLGLGIIVASIVGEINSDITEQQCTDAGFVWDSANYTCKNSTGGATQTEGDAGTNISLAGGKGLLKVANWFTTIGLVFGAVIVISALGMLFIFNKRM